VLVDSSKFASNFIYRVAPLSDVDRIITDSKIESGIRRALEQAGPELIIVKNR
jgi:DeoR/GlpR family transcriptional regulator of sugar metabolism